METNISSTESWDLRQTLERGIKPQIKEKNDLIREREILARQLNDVTSKIKNLEEKISTTERLINGLSQNCVRINDVSVEDKQQ
jgi:predicted nuclease with TOPRIM domain